MSERKLRVGMVGGGGPANFFGAPHRRAILMDNSAELTAGALRSKPAESIASARELFFTRGYPGWEALVKGEAAVSVSGGYARLILRLAEDVESEVTAAGSIIVIRFKRPVDCGVNGPRRPEVAPSYGPQNIRNLAFERRFTGQEGVKHRAQAVDVGPRSQPFQVADCLFGAHVRRRAEC